MSVSLCLCVCLCLSVAWRGVAWRGVARRGLSVAIVNVLVSSSCPSAHTNGVWIHMVATNLTMLRLALDPGISLLTSLCFSTFATPIFPDPAVSCVVSKHNKEDLSADTTKNVYRDDVHLPGFHKHDHT